jgi:hypothetical protein
MKDSQIGWDKIDGGFHLPIGVSFLDKYQLSFAVVSTVCLDGAHLRDPLQICEPETGFETMVFLNGSTLMSVYTRRYATIQEAQRGHNETVSGLRDKSIMLSIPINYWTMPGD